jgi:hypothetical protein
MENSIPYEKQSDESNRRACGAACLSMAYRSFGKEFPQAEIWPAIAKANRFGVISATTHLMAKDALARGFSAIVIQARHPLQVLRLCRQAGIRAILNHRVQRDSTAGHFTVLVDIDDKDVVLHDPLFGPARRISHQELLELWLPQATRSEVVGAVLIAIAPLIPPAPSTCEFCHAPMPLRVGCPRCNTPIVLQPNIVMGCIRDGCIARMWNWLCCPECDFVFTFKDGASTGAPAAAPRASSPEAPIPGLDLAKVFGEIDRFSSHILSIPAAANNPEIKKQLEIIAAGKEKFKVAHAETLARRTALLGQLSAITEESKQREQAHAKKQEELASAPPLDGNAIAEALLKNLGFK